MNQSENIDPEKLEKLESILLDHIRDQEKLARTSLEAAIHDQNQLVGKLLAASGAGLALLATLVASSGSALMKSDAVAPAICLGLAMAVAAVALWSRIRSNLLLSRHYLALAADLDRMKREADDQFRRGTIGKDPPPTPSELPPFPEKWISLLDYLLIAGFGLFALGIGWLAWNVIG